MLNLRFITAALVDWSSQLYAPAVAALGAEGVLSLSAQSTTDRVLDLATEIAIIAATVFVAVILVLGLWSTMTSPKTAIGRLLNNFRIDHLYLDVGLMLRRASGDQISSRRSFLRSLSLTKASIMTADFATEETPAAGQTAELALPGVDMTLTGRILRSTPVAGVPGTFNLDLVFDEMTDENRAILVKFIRQLREPARA